MNLTAHDTLTWNFWKGVGWPYQSIYDTVDFSDPYIMEYYKTFYWVIGATGVDHPMDPDGSGVKQWMYEIEEPDGTPVPLGRSGNWIDGFQIDQLSDTLRVTFRYPGPGPDHDPTGDTVFDNLPSWLNQDYVVTVTGKDIRYGEPEFQQCIFINGEKWVINQYPVGSLGRRTEERSFVFHFRLVR
jgi:hypothetical protein